MKDINGKTFQVSDVCVVHVAIGVLGELDKDWHGEICIVDELDDNTRYSVFTTIGDNGGDTWEFYPEELEIIGDVRLPTDLQISSPPHPANGDRP